MSEAIVSELNLLDRGKLNYSVCIQFLLIHLACLAAIWTGASVIAVATCLALYVVRMFAITAVVSRVIPPSSPHERKIFCYLMGLLATRGCPEEPPCRTALQS